MRTFTGPTANLLIELTKKELRLRYKRSYLGIAWSLLHPLLMMLIFTVIFTRFPRLTGSDVPYYVFFLTGHLPWNFLSMAILNGQQVLVANSGLVRQVAFNRRVLPASNVLANLVHFAIALGLWVGFLALHPDFPVTAAWLGLPCLIVLQTLFVFGWVQLLAALNVYFRDVGQIVEILLTFLFYLTPVFYSYALFGPDDRWLVALLKLNPVAHFIGLYRALLFPGSTATLQMWIYPMLWTAGTCWAGWRYFGSKAPVMAKEL